MKFCLCSDVKNSLLKLVSVFYVHPVCGGSPAYGFCCRCATAMRTAAAFEPCAGLQHLMHCTMLQILGRIWHTVCRLTCIVCISCVQPTAPCAETLNTVPFDSERRSSKPHGVTFETRPNGSKSLLSQ